MDSPSDLDLESLLNSDVAPGPRRRASPVVWLFPLLLVVGIVILALDGDEPTDGVVPIATTTTSLIDVVVDNDQHNGLLLHPAKIPAGIELCERQLGRPTTGDRFCDPSNEARWIEIALVESRYEQTVIPANAAIAAARADRSEFIEYSIGVSDQYALVFSAAGFDGGLLATVLESIPAVGSRSMLAPVQQRRLTAALGEDAALALLEAESLGGYVEESGSYLLVDVGDLSLWADSAAAVPVWDMFVGMLDATVDDRQGHWLVVGRRDGDRLATVAWIQRGRLWQLTGSGDLEALRERARSIEDAIESLS